MPILFESKTTLTGSAGTNWTPAEPSGTAEDDLLLGFLVVDVAAAITIPSGWTLLRTTSQGTTWRLSTAYVVRGASAPDMTWLHANQWRAGTIMRYSGVDPANPIDAQASAVVSLSAATTVADPPAVAAVDEAAMAIAWHMHWGGAPAGGWTAPSGYTLREGNFSAAAFGIAEKQLSVSGSEDPGTFGGTPGASEPRAADSFTLKPDPGDPGSSSGGSGYEATAGQYDVDLNGRMWF